MLCLVAGLKEASDAMPTGIEFSIMPCAEGSQDLCPIRRGAGLSCCRGRVFRPWALGFVALAISIVLWGFGYRLSRYNPHPDVTTRVLTAKFWDKHQDAAQVTSAAAVSAQRHLLPELSAAPITAHQAHALELPVSCAPAECRQAPAFIFPLSPLRSPPSSIFLA